MFRTFVDLHEIPSDPANYNLSLLHAPAVNSWNPSLHLTLSTLQLAIT